MDAVDFLHHENPPTWTGVEPQPLAYKASDKPTTPSSRRTLGICEPDFRTIVELMCSRNGNLEIVGSCYKISNVAFGMELRLSLFLTNSQEMSCQDAKPNLKEDAIVLIKEEGPPGTWPMVRVLQVHPGNDGLVRVAAVKIQDSVYKRLVHKLCKLPIYRVEFWVSLDIGRSRQLPMDPALFRGSQESVLFSVSAPKSDYRAPRIRLPLPSMSFNPTLGMDI
ncbi:hypothetical protein TNCV_4606841 [Trichonephila clavipes]|nr:hypothetical protein TNCV_4606841 [Trichonephila clavipes]